VRLSVLAFARSPVELQSGIEAAATIWQQVTGAKEPVKAAKEASGKVLASTAAWLRTQAVSG
jgi:hypothetical protein